MYVFTHDSICGTNDSFDRFVTGRFGMQKKKHLQPLSVRTPKLNIRTSFADNVKIEYINTGSRIKCIHTRLSFTLIIIVITVRRSRLFSRVSISFSQRTTYVPSSFCQHPVPFRAKRLLNRNAGVRTNNKGPTTIPTYEIQNDP